MISAGSRAHISNRLSVVSDCGWCCRFTAHDRAWRAVQCARPLLQPQAGGWPSSTVLPMRRVRTQRRPQISTRTANSRITAVRWANTGSISASDATSPCSDTSTGCAAGWHAEACTTERKTYRLDAGIESDRHAGHTQHHSRQHPYVGSQLLVRNTGLRYVWREQKLCGVNTPHLGRR
jgi:hypothetical protein